LIRDKDRAQTQNRKAQEEEVSMNKKVEELTQAIKKNVQDQADKTAEIAKQETLVASLREKLSSIR
jgi:hypothetical protein